MCRSSLSPFSSPPFEPSPPLFLHVLFPLCFLSFLLCFPLLLRLLARKWVREPLAMGNQAAAWTKEPGRGNSRHSQGKCCPFPSEIPAGALGKAWRAQIQLHFRLGVGENCFASLSVCFIGKKRSLCQRIIPCLDDPQGKQSSCLTLPTCRI